MQIVSSYALVPIFLCYLYSLQSFFVSHIVKVQVSTSVKCEWYIKFRKFLATYSLFCHFLNYFSGVLLVFLLDTLSQCISLFQVTFSLLLHPVSRWETSSHSEASTNPSALTSHIHQNLTHIYFSSLFSFPPPPAPHHCYSPILWHSFFSGVATLLAAQL